MRPCTRSGRWKDRAASIPASLGAGLAACNNRLGDGGRIRAWQGTVIGFVFQVRRLAHCLADDPKLADPLAVCKPGDVRFGTLRTIANLFNGLAPNASGQSSGCSAGPSPGRSSDCPIPSLRPHLHRPTCPPAPLPPHNTHTYILLYSRVWGREGGQTYGQGRQGLMEIRQSQGMTRGKPADLPADIPREWT